MQEPSGDLGPDDDSDDGGEGSPVRNRPTPTPRSPGDALEWPPDWQT